MYVPKKHIISADFVSLNQSKATQKKRSERCASWFKNSEDYIDSNEKNREISALFVTKKKSKHMPKENGLYEVYWSEKCVFVDEDHHTIHKRDTFQKKTRSIHSHAWLFSAQGYTRNSCTAYIEHWHLSFPTRKCFNLLFVSSIVERDTFMVYCLDFRHANFRIRASDGGNGNANKIAAHQ